MDLLITGATIVTCDDERRILEGAAIAVSGNRIAAIGDAATLERDHPGHEHIDGRGLAVLPGFINAHTHTVLTALRGTVEDWDGEIIYRYMSPVSYTMSDHERAVMASLGCLEAIRSGTTTLVDPFRHVPSYAGAMADTGMRLWLSESCADIDTRKIRFGEYGIDEAFGRIFLDRTQELIETWHGARNGRVNCQVAAHAPDNCSPAMLGKIMELARRHGLTRTCHLAQSTGEIAAVRAAHDLTPAGYLEREGFLGPNLTCAHWTFCTGEDIALLAERGVHMAHNPAPSSRKGPHRVLIGPIRDAGVNIALGTDNMTEDMFQAMKIGMILHRAGYGRAQEGGVDPQPQAVLDMVTRNGALTVGAQAQIGSIEVGKKADITLLDLNQPAMRPVLRLASNIVNYAHPGIVHSVIVDGDFVMRDRKMLTIDEPALLAEAQAVTEAVWRRMVAANADIAPPKGEMPFLEA